MSSPAPASPRVFRSLSATVGVVVAGALAILLLFDVVVRSGWVDLVLIAPWVLLALWATYVIFYASYIEIDDEGATVQNLLRRHRLPWPRVAAIDLRWQLEFVLDDASRITCFGGIVGGAARARQARRRSAPGRAVDVPPSVELDAVRDRWETAREGDAGAGIRHSWDAWALIVLAVLVTWCVIAVLVTAV
ncbi:PH domain-containing protein [Microbacterium sp. AZCO]|uniref:PH domain-containing protein n=1 Tax=Microbacterium sp. AZCO TaxID=3142976 RepID=UPI0031F44443